MTPLQKFLVPDPRLEGPRRGRWIRRLGVGFLAWAVADEVFLWVSHGWWWVTGLNLIVAGCGVHALRLGRREIRDAAEHHLVMEGRRAELRQLLRELHIERARSQWRSN